MGKNMNNHRKRMPVIVLWSGIFCLASLSTSAGAVHPSSTKIQTQLADRVIPKTLSSDQSSLQPLDLDAAEADKSQTIDPDEDKTYLESESDNRDREKDDNWKGYSLVSPDFDGVEYDVERLPSGAAVAAFGKLGVDVEKRAWKGSGRLGKKEGGKRKWSSTNLAMWGKRKWAGNNMAMWGKRDAGQTEKRKWNGNSMAMWGKRDLSGQELDEDKRKWNANSMAMWGKRGLSEQELDEEKRKWNANSMAMWGKRDLSRQELDEDKRKWNGNSMAMWGKRDLVQSGSTEPEWQRVARGWSGSKLAMWGKRDIAKKVSH